MSDIIVVGLPLADADPQIVDIVLEQEADTEPAPVDVATPTYSPDLPTIISDEQTLPALLKKAIAEDLEERVRLHRAHTNWMAAYEE